MDIIHLLPDSVANQIAAGEVIQRPASCLKELVENSLDAGATDIQIIVRDAGRTLLQVIDNGSGMSDTDARMAFERHATSKIKEANDLFSLHTMGFRGEALASICAVAHVEVQTRRKEDEMGTLIEIAGSNVVRQEPCQCSVGTNFRVRNLFYNVPARRKFLKTDQTELRNLRTEFNHIVLVYPHVHFTFVSNDEILLDLPAGSDKQRIENVFGKSSGKSFTGQFVDIHSSTDLISIRGFVGKPETAGRNAEQYFFVNGRYMRHPYFHKAVLNAYAGMLPADYAPSYFIYFTINPSAIDVNIHPTKTEIKFADEQAIFQILMSSVRESLGKFNLTPSIDFDREGEIEMPTLTTDNKAHAPKVSFDPTYNPFRPTSRPSAPSSWETLYPQPTTDNIGAGSHTIPSDTLQHFWDDTHENSHEETLFTATPSDATPIQYADRYILIPVIGGLLFINQHRAHITILYHRFLEQMHSNQAVSQQLLFPDVVELSADEISLIESISDDLHLLGFDLQQFSKQSYSICGVPALLGNDNAATALRNILQAVRDTNTSVQQEWQTKIALSLAHEVAIPYGKTLSEDEMRTLLQSLFALPSYQFTPNGKRVAFILTDNEITKKFL